MKKFISKPEKVALCLQCQGSGKTKSLDSSSSVTCPACQGSGRVWVSCDMVLNIRPFTV